MTIDFIMAYESGELTKNEIIEGFQDGIDSGSVWKLQGSYGRMATRLLELGLCFQQEEHNMRNIGEFELIDHGIEHSQYFVAGLLSQARFENVATGIGDNLAEAINDCLFQMGRDDWASPAKSMEARIMEQEGWEALPTAPSVAKVYNCEEPPEAHHHVSIRWNEGS